MSGEEYLEILQKFSSHLEFNSILGDTLNYLGYKILKFLYVLATACYNAYTGILDLTNFFDFKKINDLSGYIAPLIVVVFFFSIVYIGYRLMLNKKDERMDIISNLILALVFIIALPTTMTTLNSISKNIFDSINSFDSEFGSRTSSPIDKIFKTLFIDVQKLNDENFENSVDYEKPNNLSADDLNNLRINKLVENPKGPLNYVLNGPKTEDAPKTHWYSIANHGYYAWDMLFWQGSLMLLIIAYVYFLVAFKQGAVIYNLAVLKILSPIFMFSDIHSGQRQKAVIKEILNSYIMLVGAYLLVLIYTYFMIFIINSKANFILKIIMLWGGGMATANAGIFERILGVENISSRGFNPMQSFYQLSFIARSLPRIRGNRNNNSNKSNSNNSEHTSDQSFNSNSENDNLNDDNLNN